MPVTPNTTFHAPNNCDQQIFSFKQFHNSFHQLIFVEWECMYVIKLIHVESAWSRDGFECIGLRAYGCSVEPTNRPTGAMSTTHSQHNTIRFARMCQTLTSLPMQDDALLRSYARAVKHQRRPFPLTCQKYNSNVANIYIYIRFFHSVRVFHSIVAVLSFFYIFAKSKIKKKYL